MSVSSTHPPSATPSAEQLWQLALGQLQLQMAQATFDNWVKDTYVISPSDQEWVIGVKNTFAQDWCRFS